MQYSMDVYAEIALFFNEPIEEVKEKCSQAYFRQNKLWKEANPFSEKDRILWYRTTDAHIYEEANWHNMHLEVRKRIADKAYGNILCFGAGIGTESIMAAEMGKEVTFYDLQSLIFKFLKFRVNLRNLKNVKFIDNELVKKEKDGFRYYAGDGFAIYDTIICIDVLEHLEYPQEILNFLSRHLKSNGLFLVSSPFSELEYTLEHLPQNRYLDIDLMMKIAKIKNYKKEVLSHPYRVGVSVSLIKILVLNLISILQIRNSLKHRILYGLTFMSRKTTDFLLSSLRKIMKHILWMMDIKRDGKLYLTLKRLFYYIS